jgi:RHS repeat-associated protein
MTHVFTRVFTRAVLTRALLTSVITSGLLGQSALAQNSTRQISLPNQDYTESTQDLVVKVMGVSEAFGAAGVLPQSITQMNLRFPGQYWDQETQTHYNFNRDYRPTQGRYLQSDPMGLDGGVNFYSYALSNPIAKFDPNGEIVIVVNPYTIGAAVVGIVIVYEGCKAAANGIALAVNSVSDKVQQGIEHRAYKARCRQTPPNGLNKCDAAKFNAERWKDCYNMRKAYQWKWHGNEWDSGFETQLEQVQMSIMKALEIINSDECCKNCT